ncbi:MAG: DsbA family oxidoreductase [Caulobacteraceae bacterium]
MPETEHGAAGRAPFQIDYVGDVVCPWCYLGWARLKSALKTRADIDPLVLWRPFQLQFDIPEQGLPYAAFMAGLFPDAERRRQMDEHLKGLGAAEGLDFRFDLIPMRPNTNAAHRVIRWAGEHGVVVAEAIMRAHFTQGRDVGDHQTLAAVAGEQGMDAQAVLEGLESGADVMAVDQECAAASRAGVSGVPFMVFASRVALSGAEAHERILLAIDKALELQAQNP